MFIITKQSGVSAFRKCIIGEGETKAQAWESAYGPKPWSKWNRQSARDADCEEVSEEEYYNLINNQ